MFCLGILDDQFGDRIKEWQRDRLWELEDMMKEEGATWSPTSGPGQFWTDYPGMTW
ncbi:hypothetical protein V5E97_26175 [Singulisphaera sp. Ch08]|uniref:Uncharacterized protein n=1 Tax=Singulisphaera sp. Ch08 TaxID=3120278 RepID=A0AAU7C9M6_9BACT